MKTNLIKAVLVSLLFPGVLCCAEDIEAIYKTLEYPPALLDARPNKNFAPKYNPPPFADWQGDIGKNDEKGPYFK